MNSKSVLTEAGCPSMHEHLVAARDLVIRAKRLTVLTLSRSAKEETVAEVAALLKERGMEQDNARRVAEALWSEVSLR